MVLLKRGLIFFFGREMLLRAMPAPFAAFFAGHPPPQSQHAMPSPRSTRKKSVFFRKKAFPKGYFDLFFD
jgi:hypothetical protein